MHPFKYVSFKEFWLCFNWETLLNGKTKPTKISINCFQKSVASVWHLTPECMFLAYSISTIFMGGKKTHTFFLFLGKVNRGVEFSEGTIYSLKRSIGSGDELTALGPCSSTDFSVWPWTNDLTSLCLSFSKYKMEIMIPTIAYLIGMLWGQMR